MPIKKYELFGKTSAFQKRGLLKKGKGFGFSK
jgi:hypothetical protein